MKRVFTLSLLVAGLAIPQFASAQENIQLVQNFGTVEEQLAEEEAAILEVLEKRPVKGPKKAKKEKKRAANKTIVVESAPPAPKKTVRREIREVEVIEVEPEPIHTSSIISPELRELEMVLTRQKKDLQNIEQTKKSLQNRIDASEERAKKLAAELERTREELLLAETEVDRLSKIIESRNIQAVRSMHPPKRTYTTKQDAVAGKMMKTSIQEKRAPAVTKAPIRSTAPSKPLTIATIKVNKANLRTGPGLNHSILLTVGRDSSLVVEKRKGTWYRVIAPTGERAWVASEVIHFGPKSDAKPNSVTRIKGVYNESGSTGGRS